MKLYWCIGVVGPHTGLRIFGGYISLFFSVDALNMFFSWPGLYKGYQGNSSTLVNTITFEKTTLKTNISNISFLCFFTIIGSFSLGGGLKIHKSRIGPLRSLNAV